MTNAIQALNELERRIRAIDLPGVQIIGRQMALIALIEYRQELEDTCFNRIESAIDKWEEMQLKTDVAIAKFESNAIEAMRREEDEYHEAQLEAEAERQAQNEAYADLRRAGGFS